jgi:hypothetical protein
VDAILLGYDAMSLHNWFAAFQRHDASECQELCTLLHGIISQKNEILSNTTENCRLAEKFFLIEVLYSSNLIM